ncbi:MAG: hypothetical protein KatS3mg102_1178 [Planctomycetota bacterium]|nr:MAG: hypothetical protein KatS3mg102_1178 [Planctomycetota bacterium]
MSPPDRLRRALAAVAAALSALPARSMLIGGLAVVLHGIARLTRDIDVTVAAGEVPLSELFATFARHGIVPRISDAQSFAQANQVLLLEHEPTGVEVDVSLGWLPFELQALERAQRMSAGGIELPVASPEDLVVYKFTAFRPQDQQDIERLLALHGHRMDLARVRSLAREIARVLEEPERFAQLQRWIADLERPGP